jgi:cysteine-rich repeat protein
VPKEPRLHTLRKRHLAKKGPDVPDERPPPGCGDGELEEVEICDDANVVDGDGCAANCQRLEGGFSCAAPGIRCIPIASCGDGVVALTEQCDDGAKVAGMAVRMVARSRSA